MSIILAMCLFALSMSISPGPVNVIALSVGANRGFRRAMPYVSGATIGFTCLLALVGLGLAAVVVQFPQLLDTLVITGSAYMSYVGYRIATATPDISFAQENTQKGQVSFQHGFLLQFLNPKAWIACISGISAFVAPGAYTRLAVFCSLYFLICYLSIASWAFAGDKIQPLLKNKQYLQLINRVLGGLLIGIAVYLIAKHLSLI